MEEKNKDIVAGGQQEISLKMLKIVHAVSGKSKKILQSLTAKFEIVPSVSGQSNRLEIMNAVSSQSSMVLIFQSLTGKYLIMTSPHNHVTYRRTTHEQ